MCRSPYFIIVCYPQIYIYINLNERLKTRLSHHYILLRAEFSPFFLFQVANGMIQTIYIPHLRGHIETIIKSILVSTPTRSSTGSKISFFIYIHIYTLYFKYYNNMYDNKNFNLVMMRCRQYNHSYTSSSLNLHQNRYCNRWNPVLLPSYFLSI